jgi:hypothetical protein
MSRLSKRVVTTLCVIALPALAATGCGTTTTTATTTPTAPATSVTESFTGTLSVNGATTFNFAATSAGSVTATVQSISPATTAVLGLGLGTWNGTACQIVIANDAATAGVSVNGATTAAGNLCVRVYDVGKLTATQAIAVNITHF